MSSTKLSEQTVINRVMLKKKVEGEFTTLVAPANSSFQLFQNTFSGIELLSEPSCRTGGRSALPSAISEVDLASE